ncbi:MAG: glycosyltransferase family 2 protein [Candidatus Roizmanbacteria bacterium]|nr:glycosyltransferase family 2 protein [Candidatus Roizmanbacteria bacterium]
MKKISILLPVYNEVSVIESVIQEWSYELTRQKMSFELVICEDGSSDGTSQLLRKIQKKYSLVLNQKKARRGYGDAIIDGIKMAQSEYIVSIDSDGQCDASDFRKFWDSKNKSDIVIGWRTKRLDAPQRKLFSLLFKVVFNMLFPCNIHDPSAPFVLYKKKTVLPYIKYIRYLKEGFWWGFIATAVTNGLTVSELPMNHRNRLSGESVVYKINEVPGIAIRNLFGLFKLKMVFVMK